MAWNWKPRHLERYHSIARLLAKHARAGLAQPADLDEALVAEESLGDAPSEGAPEELARDLEELGPTFVKLGQLLSTRTDLLPAPYLDALARLQDQVEPVPFPDIARVIEAELGGPIEQLFSVIDPVPLAAASLAQVHRAELATGEVVAVKVQRPGIRPGILADLEAFDEVARWIDATDLGRRYAFRDLLGEFRRSLLGELDFRREAKNLRRLGEDLSRYRRLVVPQPVSGHVTSKVLVMDLIHGVKVDEVEPVRRAELDGAALADELCRAFLDQILVHGFFHADLHPGNVLVTDDGRVALLDLGMASRVDPSVRERLLKLLFDLAEGRGRDAAGSGLELGYRLEDFDHATYTLEIARVVDLFHAAAPEQIDIGRVVLEVTRRSAEAGLRPVPELAMLGKGLLHVDAVSRALDPGFDPDEVVRDHAASILRDHMWQSMAPGNLMEAALEMHDLARRAPPRLNRFFETLSRNELRLHVDAVDEKELMSHLRRIANRIALALVLAALIVGAALMMRVETDFQLLGYPGVAMILFGLAAACIFALVADIFLEDYLLLDRSGRRSTDRRRGPG